MSKIKVLVLGCGNIGCGYDWDSSFVKTHCKALSQLEDMEVAVYDANAGLSQKAAARYGFTQITAGDPIEAGSYDWVVIASPTTTHFEYLKACFLKKVPLVICEKPVAASMEDLAELEKLYAGGETKVVVNYIRRFQKAYASLKERLDSLPVKPSHISVTYQRGLNNNFSHAADLLGYLLDGFFLAGINIASKIFDEFEQDPTLSFTAMLNDGVPFFAAGIGNAHYAYFEIEIYYPDHKIHLAENGNKIIWYNAAGKGDYYLPLATQPELSAEGILDNLMTGVYDYVQEVYNNNAPDNFMGSTTMNKTILKIAAWPS